MTFMDEKDADKTWCRYAVVMETSGSSGNRAPTGGPAPGTACLGPLCQTWVRDPTNPSRGRCADAVIQN